MEEERASLVAPADFSRAVKEDKPVVAKVPINLKSINEMSVPDLNSASLRSKFPLSDRLSLALCRCCNPKLSPRSQLREQAPLFKFTDQYNFEREGRNALRLKVHETGSLVLDHHMVHPFVRVHIVNMETCKYLAKEDRKKPSVANIESADFMDAGKNHTSSQADFLLPFST